MDRFVKKALMCGLTTSEANEEWERIRTEQQLLRLENDFTREIICALNHPDLCLCGYAERRKEEEQDPNFQALIEEEKHIRNGDER